MKSKFCKLIISVVLVACMFCSFAMPAHALSYSTKQRIGAWISSALMALQVYTQAGVGQELQMLEWLGDPMNVTYTYEDSQIGNYFDQSTIQVWPDYVTIDGVEYTDIWISHDVANKFRINAGDFITANQIVSNTQGVFAEGVGTFDGEPVYTINGESRTIGRQIPREDGTYPLTANGHYTTVVSQDGRNVANYKDGSLYKQVWNTQASSAYPIESWMKINTQWQWAAFQTQDTYGTKVGSNSIYNGPLVLDPFDFDYVANEIPAEPLPQDDGLMIRVPSSQAQDLLDYVDDNPEFKQDGGYHVDIDLPGVEAKLDDLFDLIVPLVPIIDSFNTVNHSEPAPSYDTISNTYYDVLENQLDNIIQTIQDTFDNFTENFNDAIESILDALGDILDKILEDIELGPIKVFDKALDILKNIFAPILLLLRNALGIWHYVVDWLSAISAPFTFFIGIMSGMGTLFMLPFYACVAGVIVIAVYKRFGR